jgi:predicted nucleic acid-binding protein
VVLDSQGLWVVARNDSEDARAVLAASHQAGVPVLVPAAVLAETLFGDERDAGANQALKKLHVVPLTESVARSAAVLKRLAGMTGVAATIDAVVVATSAAAGGGVVLTSDVDDVRALANCATSMRIRPIRV